VQYFWVVFCPCCFGLVAEWQNQWINQPVNSDSIQARTISFWVCYMPRGDLSDKINGACNIRGYQSHWWGATAEEWETRFVTAGIGYRIKVSS